MSMRPVGYYIPHILLVVGCLMAAGARAQDATSNLTSEPQLTTGSDAAGRPAEDAVQPAAAPGETTSAADRPTQAAQRSERSEREREEARLKRQERREIISEGIGIPVDELNDLLRRVRTPAEERRATN